MSTEGGAGVCLEAAGPAQQLAVYNLQSFHQKKRLFLGKHPSLVLFLQLGVA